MLDSSSSKREKFMKVCKVLVETRILNDFQLMKERLEVDLLTGCGIIPDDQFQKRIVKWNTAITYKQNKFNLILECIAGYSHLFTMLNQDEMVPFELLLETIGKYNLDPNTCLEIIIDVVSTNIILKYPILVQFLSSTQLTNTKIRDNLANCIASKEKKFENESNKSNLLKLACLLLRDKWICLDNIVVHYTHQNEDISKFIVKKKNDLLHSIAKLSKVSLSAANESEKLTSSISLEKHPSIILIITYWLDYELFDEFLILLKQFPDACAFVLTAKKLAEFVYTSLKKSRDQSDWFSAKVKHFASYDEFKQLIVFVLKALQTNLSLYPALLSTLFRIAHWAVNKFPQEKEFWLSITVVHLVGNISCLSNPNPSILNDFGLFLKNFSYSTRFYVYGEWRKLESSNLQVKLATLDCSCSIKKSMRRLAKENVKQIGRTIGKLSNINPFSVFRFCLEQIQAYDNLIQPLSDSSKYLVPICYDILGFSLIDSLSNPDKDRLKNDGTNISDWLQNLAVLCGILYKKYSHFDLEPLLQYVFNQLNIGNSLDLVVLGEIVYKMAGCETFLNLSEGQLEGLAGGPILKAECLGPSQSSSFGQGSKNSRKSSSRLVSCLTESNLFFPLWLLIAQQKNALIFAADFEHLKLLGSLVDQCQQILIQFTELSSLKGAINAFPAISSLIEKFKVDPEIAYSLIKSPSKLSFNSIPELFWSLSLSEIFCPTDLYQNELKRLRSQIEINPNAMETDKENRKEKEKVSNTIEKLEKEQMNQMLNVSNTLGTITNKISILREVPPTNVEYFLIKCLIPRCCFSSADSLFVTKFLQLAENHFPDCIQFPVLLLMIIKETPRLIVCLTEQETSNYARLLKYAFSRSFELRDELARKEIFEASIQIMFLFV